MTFLKQMIDNEKERSETMRILALDSSGLVASVAVVEEEQTIAEYTVNYKDLGPLPGCELDRRRRKDLDSR